MVTPRIHHILSPALRQLTKHTCFRCILVFAELFFINFGATSQVSSHLNRSQLYEQAQRALARDDYDSAIQALSELTRLVPQSAPLFLQLGVAYYQKGDYKPAEETLRRALELEPDLPVAEAFLGLSEAALQHSDLSIFLLEKSVASQGQTLDQELIRLVRLRLGQVYSDAGRLDDAESVYMSLLKDYPHDPQVLSESFWLHMTSARQIMRTLLREAPDSYRTHEMLAHLLAEKGNYPAAAEQFRAALKANPMGLSLHYKLGTVLWLQSSDAKTAIPEYEEELRLHAFHAPSYCQLAGFALSNEQVDRAWNLYSKALQFKPDYPEALVGLCKICVTRNQFSNALSYCEKAAKADPFDRVAHYQLAKVYRALGRTDDAKVQMAMFEKLRFEASKTADFLVGIQVGNPTEP